MKPEETRIIVSSFLGTETEAAEEKEIEKISKQTATGALCDGYIVEYDHRKFFMKRLKEEFRGRTFYREALRKEYEIGTELSHRSLPRYRGIGEDYVLMDYIEGETLREMIGRSALWLKERKNIDTMLVALLDATGYLHKNGIVHCDIKADNIIINEKTGRIVLLDLDKCYSDSRTTTAGDPNVYGLSHADKGNPEIDFRGIGMILETLRKDLKGFPWRHYRKLERQCFRRGVRDEDLYATLTGTGRSRMFRRLSLAGMVIIIALSLFYFLQFKKGRPNAGGEILVENEKTTTTETFVPTEGSETIQQSNAIKDGEHEDIKGGEIQTEEERPSPPPYESGVAAKQKSASEVKEAATANMAKKEEDQIILDCLSGAIPLMTACETMLENPKPEYRERIEENVERIERYMKEGIEKAIEKIANAQAGKDREEIEKIIEGSDAFQEIRRKIGNIKREAQKL